MRARSVPAFFTASFLLSVSALRNGIRIVPLQRSALPLAQAVNRFLKVAQLEELCTRARTVQDFNRGVLDDLQLEAHIAPADFAKIPRAGTVVAVSNDPFGILDGVILTDSLMRAAAILRS